METIRGSVDVKALDIIRLTDGRNATVLDVFDNGAAYLVEIADENGKTLDMPFVARDEIREVIWRS